MHTEIFAADAGSCLFIIIFIGLYVAVCVWISYKKSEENYTIIRAKKPDTEITMIN